MYWFYIFHYCCYLLLLLQQHNSVFELEPHYHNLSLTASEFCWKSNELKKNLSLCRRPGFVSELQFWGVGVNCWIISVTLMMSDNAITALELLRSGIFGCRSCLWFPQVNTLTSFHQNLVVWWRWSQEGEVEQSVLVWVEWRGEAKLEFVEGWSCPSHGPAQPSIDRILKTLGWKRL